MRNFIDIINKTLLTERTIREFANDGSVNNLDTVVSELEHYLGEKLYRVGGSNRVYEVSGAGFGAVYVIGQGTTAICISWPNRSAGVRSIYVWYKFSLLNPPEFCFDLPKVDFELLAPTMAKLIINPIMGKTIVTEAYNETRDTLNEAKRIPEGQFVEMVRAWAIKHNKDITKISYQPDLIDVSKENDVMVPGDVRNNKKWKTNRPGVYNFSENGESGNEQQAQQTAIQNLLGAEITPLMPNDGEEPDVEFDNALNLAKVKQLRRFVGQGKLTITGRKNGKFVSFPKDLFDQVLAMVERLLTQELSDNNSENPEDEGKTSMEIQYEDLHQKVRHIASGKSTFIKSLLITGSPSSGKSWSVMSVIKALGLIDGKDYVYKKGNVTVSAMYRILIEQANGGMAVFDDCDSVLTDQDGLNILKGALDTDKVREVSYDKSRGIVNTAVMSVEEREVYVSHLSDLLRGKVPTVEDAKFFEPYVPRRALKQSRAEMEADAFKISKRRQALRKANEYPEDDVAEGITEDDDEEVEDDLDDLDFEGLTNREARIIEYVKINLPNKIDFKGRIIFISNMSVEEFASQGKGSGAAILSRAFYVNLSFSSGEMLDFIEKIQDKIEIATLTTEEKKETMDYIRARYSIGGIKADINFRLIMIAFEYRAMGKEGGNWKRQINSL